MMMSGCRDKFIKNVRLTKILHILITKDGQCIWSFAAGTSASAKGLVNDNAIGDCRSDKGSTVRVASGTGVVVEGNGRDAVADKAQ